MIEEVQQATTFAVASISGFARIYYWQWCFRMYALLCWPVLYNQASLNSRAVTEIILSSNESRKFQSNDVTLHMTIKSHAAMQCNFVRLIYFWMVTMISSRALKLHISKYLRKLTGHHPILRRYWMELLLLSPTSSNPFVLLSWPDHCTTGNRFVLSSCRDLTHSVAVFYSSWMGYVVVVVDY